MIQLKQSYMSTLSSCVPVEAMKECENISRLDEMSVTAETEELQANVNLHECDLTLHLMLKLFNTRITAFSTYLEWLRPVKMTVCLIAKKCLIFRHCFVS